MSWATLDDIKRRLSHSRRITGGGLRLRATFPTRVRQASDEQVAKVNAAVQALGADPDDGLVMSVLMSVTARARDGHRITGWELDHFRQHNPVHLWDHDPSALPIGRTPVVWFDKKAGELRGLTQFTPHDLSPHGYQVGQMVLRGYLNQPSVSWDTMDAKQERDPAVLSEFPYALEITRAELLELSTVSIEADKGSGFGRAFARAEAAGLEVGAIRADVGRAIDEGTLSISRVIADVIACSPSKPLTVCIDTLISELPMTTKRIKVKKGKKSSTARTMDKEEFLNARVAELMADGRSPVDAIREANEEFDSREEGEDLPDAPAPDEGGEEVPAASDPGDERSSADLAQAIADLSAQMGDLMAMMQAAMGAADDGRSGDPTPGGHIPDPIEGAPEGGGERNATDYWKTTFTAEAN